LTRTKPTEGIEGFAIGIGTSPSGRRVETEGGDSGGPWFFNSPDHPEDLIFGVLSAGTSDGHASIACFEESAWAAHWFSWLGLPIRSVHQWDVRRLEAVENVTAIESGNQSLV